MAVPSVNITIEKGTDFQSVFTIANPDGTSLDLTGQTAVAKIKKFPSSTISTSFSVGIVTSAGQVVLSMGNTITNNLDSGRYYYDVVVTSSMQIKRRVIEGMALVTASAST